MEVLWGILGVFGSHLEKSPFLVVLATVECIGSTSEYAVSTLGYIGSNLGYLGSIWISPEPKLLVYQQFQDGNCKNHHFRPFWPLLSVLEVL